MSIWWNSLFCEAPHKSLGMRLGESVLNFSVKVHDYCSTLLPYCRSYSLVKVVSGCYTSDCIAYNKCRQTHSSFTLYRNTIQSGSSQTPLGSVNICYILCLMCS